MARGGLLKAAELNGRRETRGKHSDGAGLYFVVASPGSANWSYRYMLDGKAREMGLGPFPAVSLAQAREKALAAHALKAQGIDPLDHRRSAKDAARLGKSRAKTFEQCARDFYDAHSGAWKSKVHKANWLQQMADYVYPLIGARLVSDIGTEEIVAVLGQMTGPPNSQHRLWEATHLGRTPPSVVRALGCRWSDPPCLPGNMQRPAP